MTGDGGRRRSLGGTIVRSGLSAFSLRLAGRGIAYVFALLVARSAGAEAWGAFALTLAFISAGALVALTGFDTAILKLTSEAVHREDLGLGRSVLKVVALATVQSVLVIASLLALAPIIATELFGNEALVTPLRIGAVVVFPTAIVNVLVGAINGLRHVSLAVFVQFILRLGLPTAIFLALPAQGPVVAYAAGNFLLLVIAILLLQRVGKGAKQWSGPSVSRSSLYSLSIPLMLVSSMGFLRGWSDTVLVGVFLDTASMGIYDICFKLASAVSLPLLAVNGIVSPLAASASATGDWREVERSAQMGAALSAGLAAVPALIMIAAPEWVLGFFGPEFPAGALTLRVLAISYFLNAGLGIGAYVMSMVGLHKSYQYVAIVSTVISILLNIVLLPVLGLVGAAIASLISVLANAVVPIVLLYRFRGIRLAPALQSA